MAQMLQLRNSVLFSFTSPEASNSKSVGAQRRTVAENDSSSSCTLALDHAKMWILCHASRLLEHNA